MTGDPVSESPPARPKWVGTLVAAILCGAVLFGFRWLTAAEDGEKCGGATGCASGLVCVQVDVALVDDVVENRRCRPRCKSDADCLQGRQCVELGQSGQHACIGGVDLR